MKTGTNFCRTRDLVFLLAVVGCATSADALVIDAVADTWIRESDTLPAGEENPNQAPDPDRTYGDDLISVWAGIDSSDLKRNGVVLFDLSSVGVTIDSAYIQLFDRADGRSTTTAIVQQAYLLPTTPTGFINDPDTLDAYTWAEYAQFDEPDLQALDALGSYDIAAGDLIGGYEASDLASAGDLSLLQQARNNSSNVVMFVFQATSGERDWGDIESQGTPPQLVINEDLPPVFGDFTGDRMVTTADYDVMNDPANWLQTVPAGTRGDITEDGFVDLTDFSTFKPVFLLHNPQGSLNLSSSQAVPEPATSTLLALLAAGIVGWTLRNRNLTRNSIVRGLMMNKLMMTMLLVSLFVPTVASAVVLEASYDSWIRSVDASDVNLRDNDYVTAASTTSVFGEERYGVLEFDLSSIGVPITSAHLQLWNQLNGFGDDGSPADQTATLIDGTWVNPAGGGANGVGLLDWTGINNAISSGTALNTMGNVSIPAHVNVPANLNGGEYINTSADASDLAALNADRTSDQLATFVLTANELGGANANTWGDQNSVRAVLTINESPVPSPAAPLAPFGLSEAVWLRDGQALLGDGVLVTNNPEVVAGAPTVGLMEWDLSHPSLGDPADLIGARLEFFVADASRTHDPGQIAGLIDTTGGTPLTGLAGSAEYVAEYGGTETPLEGLGVVPDTTGPLLNGQSIVTVATAADLQRIRDVMNGTDLLTFAFGGSDALSPDGVTGQYWGDGDFGTAAILTLEFVPDSTELTLQIDATTGQMWIANPTGDPEDDMTFDIDGYVIHSPDGSLNPGGFTGLVGEGEPGWQIVAPTMDDLTETNLTSSSVFEEGDSLSLGTGYMPGAAEDTGLTFEYSVAGVTGTTFGFVEFVTNVGVAGDYDGNGVVDAADYTVWRDNLGASITLPNENPNAGTPGLVDAEDYAFWKSRFGATSGSGNLNAATVPEPVGLVLMGLGSTVLLCWRRRFHRIG